MHYSIYLEVILYSEYSISCWRGRGRSLVWVEAVVALGESKRGCVIASQTLKLVPLVSCDGPGKKCRLKKTKVQNANKRKNYIKRLKMKVN